ncbi:MAG: hypothetical protein QOD83_3072 [Solirubrobacteraceae bacterium]|nr:hypothetical protein [Solirubrobacteraceae bacterium]
MRAPELARRRPRGTTPRNAIRSSGPACAWRTYDRYGTGRLGIGLGQYLITPDEVSGDVREAFIRARAYWSARGVALPEWLPWDA